MALSTRILLENQATAAPLSDTFSVMYTPMDSGEYPLLSTDGVSGLLAISYEMLPFILALALSNMREPEEETIDLIMKRLGVQKSVSVTRDLVAGGVFCLIWFTIYSVIYWAVIFKDKIGLGLILLFGLLTAIQIVLRSVIFQQVLPGKGALLLNIALLLVQISL